MKGEGGVTCWLRGGGVSVSEKYLQPTGQPQLKPSISMTAGTEEGPAPTSPPLISERAAAITQSSNYTAARRAEGPAPGVL